MPEGINQGGFVRRNDWFSISVSSQSPEKGKASRFFSIFKEALSGAFRQEREFTGSFQYTNPSDIGGSVNFFQRQLALPPRFEDESSQIESQPPELEAEESQIESQSQPPLARLPGLRIKEPQIESQSQPLLALPPGLEINEPQIQEKEVTREDVVKLLKDLGIPPGSVGSYKGAILTAKVAEKAAIKVASRLGNKKLRDKIVNLSPDQRRVLGKIFDNIKAEGSFEKSRRTLTKKHKVLVIKGDEQKDTVVTYTSKKIAGGGIKDVFVGLGRQGLVVQKRAQDQKNWEMVRSGHEQVQIAGKMENGSFHPGLNEVYVRKVTVNGVEKSSIQERFEASPDFEQLLSDRLGQVETVEELKLVVKSMMTLMIPVLQGVQHLHANGVVHRDIKGANVQSTEEGELKVADFDFALDERGCRSTGYAGSMTYMPRAIGEEWGMNFQKGVLQDHFALGCMLEGLSGAEPKHIEESWAYAYSTQEFGMEEADAREKSMVPESAILDEQISRLAGGDKAKEGKIRQELRTFGEGLRSSLGLERLFDSSGSAGDVAASMISLRDKKQLPSEEEARQTVFGKKELN